MVALRPVRGATFTRTLTFVACVAMPPVAAAPQPPVAPPPGSKPAAPVPPSAAAATPAPPDRARDGSIVHVLIETVVVDRGGTRTVGTDEADLLPGAAGVLRKEITLTGRDRRRTPEAVVLEARLTPEAAPAGGGPCALRLEAETRRQATGPRPAAGRDAVLDHREMLVALGDGEERIVEAYASSMTGGRIALRLRCGQARADDDGIPDLVTLDLDVEKRADDEPTELLRSQRLVAAIGREVSTVIVANQGLPDAADGGRRYRRERLEATLSPVALADGRIQVDVRFSGDITTMRADGSQSLVPFEHSESCLLRSGERRAFNIVVASGAADSGWTRITLAVEVIARF
jgi:hypothetical protein